MKMVGKKKKKEKKKDKGKKPDEKKLSAEAEQAFREAEQAALTTEASLMELYGKLVEFYTRYKPDNLDEDVLTILIQYVIDTGSKNMLNKKLMDKYGEDLNTFDPTGMSQQKELEASPRPPPPPKPVDAVPTQTLGDEEIEAKLKPSGEKKPTYQEGRPAPHPPTTPKRNTMARIRKSIRGRHAPGDLDRLDTPKQELDSRDLLEAYYSVYDESKLNSDVGVEKFVIWAEKNGLEALSDKLEAKYNHGLLDKEIERIALRRRNLEDTIIAFYTEYDQAKLGTRFTILNIVNWTMKHGLTQLNDKFKERYGRVIINLDDDDDISMLDV